MIVSHTNARRFYDIERNISDEQIKMIGARGGVIGINAILVSAKKEEATLDRYVDHIEHVANLIGIDGVGIGFDFCEFLWRRMPAAEREKLESKLTKPHFLPDLAQSFAGAKHDSEIDRARLQRRADRKNFARELAARFAPDTVALRIMTTLERIQNFIDGQFVEPVGGKYLDNIEPATGKPYSQVPDSDARDVELAVAAAEKAFPVGRARRRRIGRAFSCASRT